MGRLVLANDQLNFCANASPAQAVAELQGRAQRLADSMNAAALTWEKVGLSALGTTWQDVKAAVNGLAMSPLTLASASSQPGSAKVLAPLIARASGHENLTTISSVESWLNEVGRRSQFWHAELTDQSPHDGAANKQASLPEQPRKTGKHSDDDRMAMGSTATGINHCSLKDAEEMKKNELANELMSILKQAGQHAKLGTRLTQHYGEEANGMIHCILKAGASGTTEGHLLRWRALADWAAANNEAVFPLTGPVVARYPAQGQTALRTICAHSHMPNCAVADQEAGDG
jgi:hypothetical protein